jgi:hypothetical protein
VLSGLARLVGAVGLVGLVGLAESTGTITKFQM